MPGTSNEPNPEAPKVTLAATEGTTSAAGTSSGRTEGSRDPAIRVVPFQSMPQSTQEELGKELFDDPLLSIDNVKKLADYMQWSFKYTKINCRGVANHSRVAECTRLSPEGEYSGVS
jgi:cytochrome c peroxidase